MKGKAMQLRTPLGDELLKLKAGDRVELSGIVYTARDEAHLRMQKDGIPFDPVGAVIYHCGPVIRDRKVIAAGPTTSARMNELPGSLSTRVYGRSSAKEAGSNGEESAEWQGVLSRLHRRLCSLASSHMILKRCPLRGPRHGGGHLGKLSSIHLPLVVGIDSCGNDIFDTARKNAGKCIQELCPRSCPQVEERLKRSSPASVLMTLSTKKRFFVTVVEYYTSEEDRRHMNSLSTRTAAKDATSVQKSAVQDLQGGKEA